MRQQILCPALVMFIPIGRQLQRQDAARLRLADGMGFIAMDETEPVEFRLIAYLMPRPQKVGIPVFVEMNSASRAVRGDFKGIRRTLDLGEVRYTDRT